jgi:hypothetical protein
MSKKLILFLLLLIPLFGKAQLAVGDWKINSIYGWDNSAVTGSALFKLIEADNKVYYLNEHYVYCYDKTTTENISYTKKNKLNDILVNSIFYNYDKKYLVVTYTTSNIDIIKDDGTVINIPDIKDAVLTSSKTINDVTFNGDLMYVATAFGYVVISDKKFEVVESHIYNQSFKSVLAVGNKILASTTSAVLSSNITANHSNYGSFNATKITESGILRALSDSTFFFKTGYFYKGKFVNDTATVARTIASQAPIDIVKTSTGYAAQLVKTSKLASRFLALDAKGDSVSGTSLPTDMLTSLVSNYDGDGNFWQLGAKGLRQVKVEGGSETVLKDFFKPNASSILNVGRFTYNTTQGKLYVSSMSRNLMDPNYGYWLKGMVNAYDGTTWEDVTPDPVTTGNTNWNVASLNIPYSLVFDPDDPNTYYVGTWYEGAFKFTNGVQAMKYDWNNSPIAKQLKGWYCCTPAIAFDKNHNLWILEASNSTAPFSVLPSAKRSLTTLTTADWITPKVTSLIPTAEYRSFFYITKKDDIKMFYLGGYNNPIVLFNDGGDPAASNISMESYSTLTDQDEKEYKWNRVFCFTEDLNGKIWMGTTNGVVEFNPADAFGSNFRVNRIKVPRNDGTSYADYLLSDESVTCIAVDGANRKWIGTLTSGVFLVSADGTQILKKLNTSNSYLTDNMIYSICCNPNTNTVYIGTSTGTLEYSSDATPASENYENVIAYPNPVKPDYTGLITVRGLMDNSLVKIADAAGNVVKSLQSTGGMVTWDGCNSNGQRVKTGVYYVLASQNESGTSSGVVTKIMIIR